MLVLLIISILGVSAMDTSSLELKMSSNAKQQTLALQNAENARGAAEQAIRNASQPLGFPAAPVFPWPTGFRDWRLLPIATAPINSSSRVFWQAGFMGVGDSRFFIEYLGNQNMQDDGGNVLTYLVFRIHAFGIDSANTDVMVQNIYVCQLNVAGC